MFRDVDLQNHLKLVNTLKTKSLVIMEWNLNDFENIENYGNYRYRSNTDSIYLTLPQSYDANDLGDYYTDGLKSSIESQTLIDENDASLIFSTPEVDRSLYYDLKQCFNSFRPRSGINKPLFFENGKYVDNIRSGTRPRYYLSSRNDVFKYWNSFRFEDGIERGISSRTDVFNIGYEISDACPFVIYKEDVAANRIVIKMQTNIGEVPLGNIRSINNEIIEDPLGKVNNSSIPKRWSVQYLNNNNVWINAISFDENSLRKDNTDIVKWDGYVELFYGLAIPSKYSRRFYFVDTLSDISQLPFSGDVTGEAYVVNSSFENAGELKIWNGVEKEWETYEVEYKFQLLQDDDTKKIGTIKNLTNPSFYISGGNVIFRDVVFLKGLRLKIETLNGPDNTFDLIELSPRLTADISDYVLGFEITKSLFNDNSSLPVGTISVSNGSMTIMNHDFAFTDQNTFLDKSLNVTFTPETTTGSIISNLLNNNTRVDFYEIIKNVNDYDKYVPIKSMYVEEFPKGSSGLLDINLSLRDSFFRFESQTCPPLFFQNVSLTFAIAVLLDSIGFGNYVFKNFTNISDPIIPYFFVEPNVSVAEVLQRLAIATQSAMFFDEYNNFVVMNKEYLLPEKGQRQIDDKMIGQKDNDDLPNIIEIKDSQTKIYNDGKINYTTRYVQKAPASLQQALYVDEDRTYGYQPVLLWEVPSDTNYKTINEKAKTGTYSLGAVALNTSLSEENVYVANNKILNNVIDVGENVYWLPRLQGYLYANGEIIKYDAIEYTIPGVGTGWISNEIEYQDYFSKLPFNGKMYPTGLVRIYSEPYYETVVDNLNNKIVKLKNGEVKKSGREQFGTKRVNHFAGLSSYWTDINNVDGYKMDSSYLFTTTPIEKISRPAIGSNSNKDWKSGKDVAKTSNINGIIANFQREVIPSDDIVKTLKTTSKGTVQSSALVFNGPLINVDKNNIALVKKSLDSDYKHFGTRMRVIGKKESNTQIQTAVRSTEYYSVSGTYNDMKTNISGGSGGIAIMLDSDNINGYYFEICTLSADNLENYNTKNAETGEELSVLNNVLFYKVVRGVKDSKEIAMPVKLWGGLAKILVDEGIFVGQDRISNETNPTVYDLAIEYKDIGNIRRFYLYINGSQVAVVDDILPLPKYNNMALFLRSSSKCMFENIYALKNQYSQESNTTVIQDILPAFGKNQINSSDALNKYSISGLVQSTYLSGISATNAPKYGIYYEEFGTILRECAYFNILYDKAYPAFRAMLKPTFGNEKTYTSSGFFADSYGAEFLIFNATDKLISLDERTNSYLQIIGITFTQNTSNTLTADRYYQNKSNFFDLTNTSNIVTNPLKQDKIYQDIKISRSKYGKKDFVLESIYIQSEDQANNLLGWILSKTLRPRKIVLLETFATPHLQLGDMVTIDYTMPSGDKFVTPDAEFIVAEIQYARSQEGPSSIIKVVEV